MMNRLDSRMFAKGYGASLALLVLGVVGWIQLQNAVEKNESAFVESVGRMNGSVFYARTGLFRLNRVVGARLIYDDFPVESTDSGERVTKSQKQMLSDVIRRLEDVKELYSLNFMDIDFENDFHESFETFNFKTSCPKLKQLSFNRCGIDPTQLKNALRGSTLDIVILFGKKFNDNHIKELANQNSIAISKLHIEHSSVTDDVVQHLMNLNGLKTVLLHENLFMSAQAVSDLMRCKEINVLER